uniref:Putative secreted protein n=1 Tax=Ixodes ricinus TaxID=34613 RepID=A0A6B0TVR9_IXORI
MLRIWLQPVYVFSLLVSLAKISGSGGSIAVYWRKLTPASALSPHTLPENVSPLSNCDHTLVRFKFNRSTLIKDCH